ncbi:ankyrin repeat-containing domain protein [Mycena olivaceomarginata]|nr:ankyrin repeat-containing domain protein [Mycena olivaceomarginata]
MWEAASIGHTEIAQLLLATGVRVEEGHPYGGCALQAACKGGHEETVRFLLGNGASVNGTAGVYGDPLQAASVNGNANIYAAHFGNTEAVRLLLASGADVTVSKGFCGSPLQAAINGGHAEIARLLFANGARLGARRASDTGLFGAVERGWTAMVQLLLETGADVNVGGYCNMLESASHDGRIETPAAGGVIYKPA